MWDSASSLFTRAWRRVAQVFVKRVQTAEARCASTIISAAEAVVIGMPGATSSVQLDAVAPAPVQPPVVVNRLLAAQLAVTASRAARKKNGPKGRQGKKSSRVKASAVIPRRVSVIKAKPVLRKDPIKRARKRRHVWLCTQPQRVIRPIVANNVVALSPTPQRRQTRPAGTKASVRPLRIAA